jgi:Calcineurin-like phosphoesterase
MRICAAVAPLALCAALLPIACEDGRSSGPPKRPPRPPKPTTSASAAPMPEVAIQTRYPAAQRVVAIGDVHGDLNATKKALRLGGLIDDLDHWIAGNTVLVQTGDVLDRGDDEQAILDLLLRLQQEAKAAGGTVHLLNGNHELMNAMGDFRYVTAGGFDDFRDAPGTSVADPRLSRFPADRRPRAAAFLPGGHYARRFATQPVVVIVGDTVFAHGGVTPKYAERIERINRDVAAWLLGGPSLGANVVMQPDSPVWSRHFSDEPDEADCKLLEKSLGTLKAKRMVVGHTVQREIRPACGEQVWRIDVGMAAHYGGSAQVLVLEDGAVSIRR